MQYDWNVGWNFVPQIAVPVGRSSVAASVMAMISYLRIFKAKWFKTNMALIHSLILSPLLIS